MKNPDRTVQPFMKNGKNNLTIGMNAARMIQKFFIKKIHARNEKQQKKECADRDSNPGLGVGNA
jgi:hypothetical protein